MPRLRTLYDLRVRFKQIFDTPQDRRTAHRALLALFVDLQDEFSDLNGFIATFERWETAILNYFDARQTSAAVEGLNNKARVIIKRAYGLKSAASLWTRLILDVNRARDIVLYTIEQVHAMIAGFQVLCSTGCT